MRALCLIREPEHYRRIMFIAGLKRAGYDVVSALPNPRPGDVLVIWNRYGSYGEIAGTFERAGAVVWVAENGYLGKDWRAGEEWFAISEGQHNGAGRWPDLGPERWDSFGITLEPWRTGGDEIVVLPQRGVGPVGVAMPSHWPAQALQRSQGRLRPHPGQALTSDLRDDLERASAVYTWGSGAALKALLWGIPAFHDFKRWIGASAAAYWGEKPFTGDRLPMFESLANAMWEMTEITAGTPFERLREMRA